MKSDKTALQCWDASYVKHLLDSLATTNTKDLPQNSFRFDPDIDTTAMIEWSREDIDCNALALTPDRVIATYRTEESDWKVGILDRETGATVHETTLPSESLHQGIAITRNGAVVVALRDGTINIYGPEETGVAQTDTATDEEITGKGIFGSALSTGIRAGRGTGAGENGEKVGESKLNGADALQKRSRRKSAGTDPPDDNQTACDKSAEEDAMIPTAERGEWTSRDVWTLGVLPPACSAKYSSIDIQLLHQIARDLIRPASSRGRASELALKFPAHGELCLVLPFSDARKARGVSPTYFEKTRWKYVGSLYPTAAEIVVAGRSE